MFKFDIEPLIAMVNPYGDSCYTLTDNKSFRIDFNADFSKLYVTFVGDIPSKEIDVTDVAFESYYLRFKDTTSIYMANINSMFTTNDMRLKYIHFNRLITLLINRHE